MTTDIMQAYVDHLNYRNVNMWHDMFTIRGQWRIGNRATASALYRKFIATWRGVHPDFGTAQTMLKELGVSA